MNFISYTKTGDDMKKRFISKKRKIKKRYKGLFIFFVFFASLITTFNILLSSSITIDDKTLVNLLLGENNHFLTSDDTNRLLSILVAYFANIDFSNPATLITNPHVSRLNAVKVNLNETDFPAPKARGSPIIYIYNSHPWEEYMPSTFAEVSVNPTVLMTSFILERAFNEGGAYAIVEERCLRTLLNDKGWSFIHSYMASRIFMESAKEANPTLRYFIDVHRDSPPRDRTTIQIGSKSYAQVLFVIGTEHQNYEQNLNFSRRLHERLNERYPGISKGIYQKGGKGVNGLYNQDFSPYTILLELGGVENRVDEVLNTSLVFASVFMEVIREHEG